MAGGMPVKGRWWGDWCREREYKSTDIKSINTVEWEEDGLTKSCYQIEMPDGQLVKFRRVTTVIKMDPEVMKLWAIKELMTALAERWQEGIAYTAEEISAAMGYVRTAPDRKKEWAAGIGSRVHALIEGFLRRGYYSAPDPITGEIVRVNVRDEEPGVQNALIVWEDWRAKNPLEVLEIEKTVVSFRYGFCGQFDFLCRDPKTGRKFILDWKTGKDLYGDYALQLAAYGAAMVEMGLGLPVQGRALWIGRNADHYRELLCWATPDEWRERFRLYYYLCELYSGKKELNKLASGRQMSVKRR